MSAYSLDLRHRIVAAVERGMPRSQIVQTFQISLATLKRYLKQQREGGDLTPKLPPGRPASKAPALLAGLTPLLTLHSDATLPQLCDLWQATHGVRVSTATMSRAISRLGWTRKKRRWLPPSETSSSVRPSEPV